MEERRFHGSAIVLLLNADVPILHSLPSGLGELLDALVHVQNRLGERQTASLFEDRDEFVELGA